jgi:hypothetical protein
MKEGKMIRNGMFWGALGAFALVLSLVATGAAQADSPNCATVTVPVEFTVRNPCTVNGEVIALTGSETVTNCIFQDASGSFHVSITDLLSATGVGSLGNTYIVNQELSGNAILNAQGNGEAYGIAQLYCVSKGTAPNFRVRVAFHETFSNFVVSNIQTMPLETDCSGNGP